MAWINRCDKEEQAHVCSFFLCSYVELWYNVQICPFEITEDWQKYILNYVYKYGIIISES